MARGLAAATVAVVLAGFVVAPAQAGVVRAEAILPPGESGFVSVTGLPSGAGSPHLYDQTDPFIHFRYRNAMLGQSGAEERPRAGVRIRRDSYGIPSIYGDTTPDLWWGAGYATAQDRLFELEVFRRVGNGRLAELVGKGQLPMDIVDRRDFYTGAELQQMFNALPADLQQRYRDYTDGVNAWVDYVQGHPGSMPGEYPAVGLAPSHFTAIELAAIGVYLARQTPNGDGEEITNVRAIVASGRRKFSRMLPLRIRHQIATIPRRNGLFPSNPGRTRSQERRALTRSYRYVRGLPLPREGDLGTKPFCCTPEAAAAARNSLRPIRRGGSYMVTIRDRRHHRALLFNGPQLGFYAPEELYELELHGPGIDVRGITAPGAPVIAIGHNRRVAFGVTSGLTMTNHLYAERLVPGNPEQYYFRGRVRDMECRDETFNWNSGATAILGGGVPESGSATYRLCRTVHGPVQAWAGGYAYARRYATWRREVETLVGLSEVDTAASVRQVDRALAHVSWNENMMAADDRGNIGYWHPGLLPKSPRTWDERLPYPGDGRAEWRGFLPVRQRPHVINPRRGYLTNWNTLPSQGWTTGNDPAHERVAGPWFRDAYLVRLAAKVARGGRSFDELKGAIRREGTTAQQVPLARRLFRRAARRARGGARAVLTTVADWDGNYDRTDSAGTVDPGAAAWLELRNRMQRLAVVPLGEAGKLIGLEQPNNEHVFDVSIGQAYALRTLRPSQIRRAAAQAYAALSGRFKSTNPASWRAPRAMFDQTALGAEQPPPMPFFDRGTFEQFIELR